MQRKYIEMSQCKNPSCWCHQMEELEKMFDAEHVPSTIQVEIPKDFENRIRIMILCSHMEKAEREMSMLSVKEYVDFLTDGILRTLWLKDN